MTLTDEMHLISKVRSLGVKCDALDGLTTVETRREKVRTAVKEVPGIVFTVRDGKNISMASQFEKVYGCAL